jgi:hypothetical protein
MVKSYYTTQNSMQLKTHTLFISENFHLLFSGHGWCWVTGTLEGETANKG